MENKQFILNPVLPIGTYAYVYASHYLSETDSLFMGEIPREQQSFSGTIVSYSVACWKVLDFNEIIFRYQVGIQKDNGETVVVFEDDITDYLNDEGFMVPLNYNNDLHLFAHRAYSKDHWGYKVLDYAVPVK